MGDIICVLLPPESIRRQILFALSPKKGIYDPITGFVVDSFENPESVYFLTYKLLEAKPKEIDDVLITEDDIPRSYEFDPSIKYD